MSTKNAIQADGFLSVCPANTTEISTVVEVIKTVHACAERTATDAKPSEPFLSVAGDAWALHQDAADVWSLYADGLLTPVSLVEFRGEADRLRRRYNAELVLTYPITYRKFLLHN